MKRALRESKSIKELASKVVGDGKSNLWFVTIGYGWYESKDSDDFVQVEGSYESVTIMVDNDEQANEIFEAIPLNAWKLKKVEPWTVGQVTIENKHGVVKEKFLYEVREGNFVVKTFS